MLVFDVKSSFVAEFYMAGPLDAVVCVCVGRGGGGLILYDSSRPVHLVRTST